MVDILINMKCIRVNCDLPRMKRFTRKIVKVSQEWST